VTSLLTNNAAMTALTTLKSINTQLDMTSNRVSTGQRVSSAADNAAYWSIATTVRTDNASLSAVKDSLGLGSSAVDTTYNGLNSIITDLQNMRAKLQTALQPGVDRAKVQTEITAIQSKMKATADSSVSSGQNWLSVDSSASNTAYQATQSVIAGFSRATNGTISYSKINVEVSNIKLYDVNAASASVPATEAQVAGSTSLTGTSAFGVGVGTANFSTTNEVSIKLTVASGNDTIILNAATLKSATKDLTKVTTDEFLSAVNNQISASTALTGKVKASLDSAGRLTFATTGTGTGATLKVESGTVSAGRTLVDAGFGLSAGTPPGPARLIAASNYTNVDLTSNVFFIGVHDTVSDVYFPLSASSYSALSTKTSSGVNAINGTDMAAMITQGLVSSGISHSSASFSGGKIIIETAEVGPSANLFVDADADQFGFSINQSTNGTAATAGSPIASRAYGTAAGSSVSKGILDTVDGTTSQSINSINISALSGTAGDATLSALITQVDRAISSVTNAGTKLGANKTQIDGQKTFIDTLMKANDRTIGILVDADVEEESTKLRALQTQQQLAVQALSIANGASANVLSLFR
jgi:flagellin